MSVSLLLDFGATRIKSALCHDGDGRIFSVKSRPCTAPVQNGPVFEIPIEPLLADFLQVCREYAAEHPFERILVCCQMHGFALTDLQNRPLSQYISWQDERALQPAAGGPSSWELFREALQGDFKEITGMRLRAGFPAVKIFDFLRRNPQPAVKALSLAEVLCLAGTPYNKVHLTMADGSGCMDFRTKRPSAKILDFLARQTGARLEFNEITESETPAGEIVLNGKTVPVWTGIGDHQCAVLGAGNTASTWSVNVGTGSQVSAVTDKAPDTPETERRHFVEGKEMQTITHIPAGRVLAALTGFYTQLTGRDGWERFNAVRAEELGGGLPEFNLAFFADAWGYGNGGGISGLALKDLNENRLWAGLFRSFARQYVRALELLDRADRKQIILSGGKLAKNPVLANYLQKEMNLPVKIADAGDETLLGLAYVAQIYK